MGTAAVVGGTGLVGSEILSALLTNHRVTQVTALARRAVQAEEPPRESITFDKPAPRPKLNPIIEPDSTKWVSKLSSIHPPPDMFFSALATTKGLAGSFENQYKIEHDLNVELAKAAQQAGTRVYVLISAHGLGLDSYWPYQRMKAEIEEHTKNLDFKHIVYVRPGIIVGKRAETDSRPLEAVFRRLAKRLGKLNETRLKDWWAQDADVIAKAAVLAGFKCLNDEAPGGKKVWIVTQEDIIKLGRDEWKKQAFETGFSAENS
ncbi:MAG: Protein fmp52, mitochondrial [Peltula sp. TS41687]|nr:MAG: Protein fmp52, mitochondrial [Peltula sp. TS41687]